MKGLIIMPTLNNFEWKYAYYEVHKFWVSFWWNFMKSFFNQYQDQDIEYFYQSRSLLHASWHHALRQVTYSEFISIIYSLVLSIFALSVCLYLIILFTQSSMLIHIATIFLFSLLCNSIICMYTPQFISLFYCWWTFR